MENLELEIKEFENIKKVDFNYEELKSKLNNILGNYKNIIYTEDSIKIAKEDKAMLNKIAKSLNDKRIEVEREYMKPFEDFKSKVRELVDLTKDTVQKIDFQVKEFDEKQRQEKLSNVKEIIKELNTINIDESYLFEDSYLLKSKSENQIKESINQKIEKVKEDLSILEDMKPADFEDIKKYYFRINGNLSESIKELNRINELAKKVEEKVEARIIQETPKEVEQSNIFAEVEEVKEEEVKEFTLTLFTTETKFKQLKEFLKQNNIKNL